MSPRTLLLLSPFALAILLGKLATVPEQTTKHDHQGKLGMIELTMDRYAGTHRPLILFAPSSISPQYLETMVILNRNGSFLQERDLVVIEIFEEGISRSDGRAITPASAAKLREHFEIEPGASAIILVGKDKTEKRRWESLPALREIFETIDAMPMRQQEIEERKPRTSS